MPKKKTTTPVTIVINPTPEQQLAFSADTDRVLSRLQDVTDHFLEARQVTDNACDFLPVVTQASNDLRALSDALLDAIGRLSGMKPPRVQEGAK